MRLLIINGWSAPSSLWASFVDHLPAGFEARIIDLNLDLSLKSWRELIDSNVDDGSLLMGWSLGGMLAIDYAAWTKKALIGLCTVATNPSFVVRENWLHAMSLEDFERFSLLVSGDSKSNMNRQFSHMLVAGSQSRKSDQKILGSLYNEQTLANPEALCSGLKLLKRLDLREKLARLQMPVSHLYGEKDVLVPSSVSDDIQCLAPGHFVRVIPGMGHLPCFAHQTEMVDALVGLQRREGCTSHA